jgi:hypothetical protein
MIRHQNTNLKLFHYFLTFFPALQYNLPRRKSGKTYQSDLILYVQIKPMQRSNTFSLKNLPQAITFTILKILQTLRQLHLALALDPVYHNKLRLVPL